MKKLLILLVILIDCGQTVEVIVRFNGYFDDVKRLEILNEASLFSYVIPIQRKYAGFSDFDVLSKLPFLFTHPLIRDISNTNSTTLHLNQVLGRRRVGLDIPNISQKIEADKLWARGFTGKGIRVAIFDTGLTSNRQHFKNIAVERDYTDEGTPNDLVGHGTYVAGIIAGTSKRSGLAPNAELYIYKVFARNQESRTSWFLDAFNDAIQHKVDIINLSIGGTDYKDKLFMDKVEEVIERGIIFVSAVGNDGPNLGTVNNPADHSGVIGVGAVNKDRKLASFSSRGMTTMEFPDGYGRVKPDLLTFGVQIRAASLSGGYKRMSGTSVATPLITGSIALLLSSIHAERRNSMQIHQVLKMGAEQLENLSMLEQGAGQFNLLNSFIALQTFKPQITLFPSYLDMNSTYMWPYSSQPLYHTSMPLIMNLTLYNGYNSTAFIKTVVFEYSEDQKGDLIDIAVEHSGKFDKTGFFAMFVKVNELASNFDGIVDGRLRIDFELKHQKVNITFPIRIKIIQIPQNSKRILWDQFRQLNYPLGYFPRDDLRSKQNPLELNIDHPHTNFRQLYNDLRKHGFFVEVSGRPLTCTDLSRYGTLMIVDPEEEFFPQEVSQIRNAVNNGLNLIVVGDWYNEQLINEIKFEDPSSKQKQCYPETGGSNIPALNVLLKSVGFALGDQVLEGKARLLNNDVKISSGAQLRASPSTAWISTANLNDIASETLNKTTKKIENAAIFGIDWPSNVSGMVAVFGDSNCVESNGCSLIEVLSIKRDEFDPQQVGLVKSNLESLPLNDLPKRIQKSNFSSISRVVDRIYEVHIAYNRLPYCSIKTLVTKKLSSIQLNISFGSSDKQEDIKRRVRGYFGPSAGVSNEQVEADYQDYDSESESFAKNLVQYYTYRFLYFISVLLLISFLWFTILPRNRIRSLIFKPLMRLFNSLAQ